jgi:uncharacterized protein (TIGR00661 family)
MKFNETCSKRILCSALNWGFGHVSRSISILKKLQLQENTLFIACNEVQRVVFESYLDQVTYIQHEGYPFQFNASKSFEKSLLKHRKALRKRLYQEHKEVEQMCVDFQIELVVSDHRYGFYATKIPSVFITHQLNLPLPWYLFFAQWMHRRLISKFNTVWICDDEIENWAGKLSKPWNKLNAEYIGIQSRFEFLKITEKSNLFENLYVVSGPHPFSNHFLDFALNHARNTIGNHKIIVPSDIETFNLQIPENVQLILARNWKEIDSLFLACSCIVSRSGYSTIMDLIILNKRALLFPTPKQHEQEYLYKYLTEKKENLIYN